MTAEPGVVDENVDLHLRSEFLDDRLRRSGLRQVRDDDPAVGAVPLLELGGQRRQLLLPPGDEDEVVPLTREDVAELTADAGRGAGDEGNGSDAGHGAHSRAVA